MGRHPELEALLQAKYDLDSCAAEERETRLRRYYQLLDQALTRTSVPNLDRQRLEEALFEPYREFRRAKLLEERARLPRLR